MVTQQLSNPALSRTFVAANGLTEEGTSKTIMAGGMKVHYHDVGKGDPIVFLHPYGPGTTAWITWHKILGPMSQQYRCILMDLPNFAKTGPVVFEEGVHSLQAKTAVALLDALNIKKAHFVGYSQGGQSSMVVALKHPDRINKLVCGGGHIGTGGDRYLMANRPSEGSRASREAGSNPTKDNVRRYLRVHIDDEKLVTDALVDYIHYWHTYSPEFTAARAKSVSVPHDYAGEITSITAPTLLIHGRYDRMVQFEISIAILNAVTNSRMTLINNTGAWVPFERPAEYAAHVMTFLKGDW